VVWNGKYWEMDEGSVLVHEKRLEMVRNIYDGLLKTADYRERIDIEKAAILSESVRRLKEMGFMQDRTATERFWVGITVNN